MPTYEYICQKCGKAFEHEQKMSDPPLTKCPEKGCKGKVERLISAGTGVIFKGTGFYETDYKKKSGGGSGSKKPKSCPAAEGGSCDSCPAAKGD